MHRRQHFLGVIIAPYFVAVRGALCCGALAFYVVNSIVFGRINRTDNASGGAGIDQFHRGVANVIITIVHAYIRSGICSEREDEAIVVSCTEQKNAYTQKCQSTGIHDLPSGYSPSNCQRLEPEGKKIFRFVDAPLFCPAFVVAQLDTSAGVTVKTTNISSGSGSISTALLTLQAARRQGGL